MFDRSQDFAYAQIPPALARPAIIFACGVPFTLDGNSVWGGRQTSADKDSNGKLTHRSTPTSMAT